VLDLIKRVSAKKNDKAPLLNINVPDIPFDNLQGLSITRLGKRKQAEPVINDFSPKGNKVYWVGAAGDAYDCGEGTDFFAVAKNYVSITPIQIDLTDHKQIKQMKEWIK
jgi:5'-nucleotidase